MRVSLLIASLTVAHVALGQPSPPDVRRCMTALAEGQSLRDSHALLRARQVLLGCARSPCPDQIRDECAAQLVALEPRIPAVVVSIKSASGDDVVEARTSIDGRLVSDRSDGVAHLVDPGPHRLQVEVGGQTVEKQFVAEESNRAQRIAVRLTPPLAHGEPRATAQRIAGLSLGALGLAAVVTSAALGAATLGKVQQSDAFCDAANVCKPEGIALRSDARVLERAGIFAAGVGGAALIGGIALFATTPAVRPTVSLSPAGVSAAIRF